MNTEIIYRYVLVRYIYIFFLCWYLYNYKMLLFFELQYLYGNE